MPDIGEVVIVGCGSIGLPVAAAFATTGLRVLGHDVDTERVARLRHLREPIPEAELMAALKAAMDDGRLRFSDELGAVAETRAWIVAVPTPWSDEGGFDGGPLWAAIDAVLDVARDGDLLCVRSTVPVGTGAAIERRAAERGRAIGVAATPDRSVQGRSFREQFEVPHLIGGNSDEAVRSAADLFGRLGPVTLCGSSGEAEAAKLLCNVARDAMFGLANELAGIFADMGLDGQAVSEAAARDYPRLQLPRAGPVGGPCLSKDVGLLLGSEGAPKSPLLLAAREANSRIPQRVAKRILDHLAGTGPGRVALLGVAFKGRPATADLRGSPALDIAALLRAYPQLRIVGWDPEADGKALALAGLEPAECAEAAAAGAKVVVLGNDHPEIMALDLAALARAADGDALFYDLSGRRWGRDAALSPGQRLEVFGRGVGSASGTRAP